MIVGTIKKNYEQPCYAANANWNFAFYILISPHEDVIIIKCIKPSISALLRLKQKEKQGEKETKHTLNASL